MDLEAAVLAAFPDFEIDEEVLADRDRVFRLGFELGGTSAADRDWYLPMILVAASRDWNGFNGYHLCQELTARLHLAVLALCPEENVSFFKPYGIEKITQRECVILIKDCAQEHLRLLIQWAEAYQVRWGDWDEDDKLGAIIRCLSARLEAIYGERRTS